jgi:acyl-CoA synthetase (AMP-forming)/AMP-acid ligase II
MNLAELLAASARRLPMHPAVTFAGQTASYAIFLDRVLRLGHALRSKPFSLSPGDRVLLCMENSGAFLEALFACWAAGLCAVPTNAKLHPKEVAYIAGDARTRLTMTTKGLQDALAPVLDGAGPLISANDDVWLRMLLTDPLRALHPSAPEDEAWVFYTSGTTGRPKGAILSHRNLLFMAHCYYADMDHLDENDTKLHAAPLSHASGLYGLPHLFRGSHQVILKGFDPQEILDHIGHYPNVALFGAPTMVTRLVNAHGVESVNTRNLRTLYYGGGPMYVADLQRALAIFGPKLIQIFGQGESPMTITALSKSHHAETEHPRYHERLASCGVARTGVAFRVVDDNDQELPFGEIGEVITRSDCVMKGYLGNPEATAKTLRSGWLHTGDVGSVDSEGFLTLRDRSKDMIISGGSNIYPREIEEVLLRDPAVLECSVVGRPHPDWGEEAVAFVVSASGDSLDIGSLEQLCLDNMARFKRPKAWRVIEALPKNNYGKVLKTELRRMLAQESSRDEAT